MIKVLPKKESVERERYGRSNQHTYKNVERVMHTKVNSRQSHYRSPCKYGHEDVPSWKQQSQGHRRCKSFRSMTRGERVTATHTELGNASINFVRSWLAKRFFH